MNILAGIGASVRKSPYFASAVADGLQCVSVYNHMYLPVHYGDPDAEYQRLIEGVAMWDVGAERQVQLDGPDAAVLTQYLTPRYLGGTRIGQGRYVPMCDYDGMLINDPVLLKLSETRFWLSIADSDILFWAKAIAHERGWDVAVSEPDVSPLAIQGPRAEDLAADLFGEHVRDMRYFAFEETNLDGIPMVLARSGWSKQGGFELYLMDHMRGADLWRRVKTAGARYGIGPGAPKAPERVESGLISYGGDMRRQSLPADPYEMGFGPLIDLEKGHDFIGRAALERISADGPARVRVGFFVDGTPEWPGHPVPVLLGEDQVGHISVLCHSPRLGRSIAIGLVRRDLVGGADELEVDLPTGRFALEITDLPFIR